MEYGMKIGNEISMKEAAEPVGQQIIHILKAIGDNRIDRETAIKALEVLGLTAGVNGLSISNCTITGDETHRHEHFAAFPERDDSGDDA